MRVLEPATKNINEDRPILSGHKCRPMTLILVYANIHGGSSGKGCQTTVGLSTTAIFSVFGGYFFGSLASNVAVPCQPVIDCKLNDLQ